MKQNVLVSLLLLAALVGCSKPAEPDPRSIARSNLVNYYTLSNGTMVPLTDYGCDGPVRKAKDGDSYAECHAILQGYVHAEVHFCSTTQRKSCDSSRPEE